MDIGVDVGGTKIAAGLVDLDGTIHEAIHLDTPTDASELTELLVQVIFALRAVYPADAVGVAAAGLVDSRRGVVIHSPNIAWSNEPLRDNLEARTGTHIRIDNDANAAAWGEYRFGAGRGHADVVAITVGTGIGGAVIMDGKIRHGGFGNAGEFGHTRYIRDGRLCGCGQRGCAEQYASGRALHREITDIAQNHPAGAELANAIQRSTSDKISKRDFADLLNREDPGAVEALHRIGTALGELCADIQSTLDPTTFLIGGGVANLGEHLLQPVRAAYEAALPAALTRQQATLTIAQLGNDAGMIGAADLARALR